MPGLFWIFRFFQTATCWFSFRTVHFFSLFISSRISYLLSKYGFEYSDKEVGETQMDVATPGTNAINLTGDYSEKYWYRKTE